MARSRSGAGISMKKVGLGQTQYAIRTMNRRLLLPIIALLVWVTDFGVTLLLPHVRGLSSTGASLLDASTIAAFSACLIYYFFMRPVLGAAEKTAADQLETLNERMRIAARAVGFGIWDWNLKTGELVWDEFMYEIFEINRSMFAGDYDAFERTLLPEDAGRVHAELQQVFKDRGPNFRTEFRVRTSSGKIKHVAANAACVYDSDGKIDRVIGNNWDVTERVFQQARLVETSKLASLGEMSAGMAHEINNPLTVIRGKATQLIRGTENETLEKSDLLRGLRQMVDTCDRIARIIRGLQIFSRTSTHDPKVTCSVRAILEDSLSLCTERFKSNSIRLEVAEFEDIQFNGHPTELSQVILNLLNNAFDAVSGLNDPWVRIAVVRSVDRSRFQISVTDSGPGVSSAIANRIMEPFFTTKDVGKGTGLGLSISKGIVDAHGGSLSLDRGSERTRMVVELPLGQKAGLPTG